MRLTSLTFMYGLKCEGLVPLIVALLCGADLGLERTDLSDWVGEAVEFRWICPATSEAATGRKASSSSESVSVSDKGRSEEDSEVFLFLAMGRLTSGTTRSSVRGLGRLLM